MDKALIAQTVANKLFATEDAIDTAIVEATKLLSGIVEARHEMRVSAVVTDEVSAKVSAALAALSEAQSAVVGAHNGLSEVKLRLGIRTKMLGVLDKSEASSTQEQVRALRQAS
jgi:hypothetical protein